MQSCLAGNFVPICQKTITWYQQKKSALLSQRCEKKERHRQRKKCHNACYKHRKRRDMKREKHNKMRERERERKKNILCVKEIETKKE